MTLRLRCADRALSLAAELRVVRYPDIDDRIVESYSVPAAMISAVRGFEINEATDELSRMLEGTRDPEQQSGDEDELLGDILAARIQVYGGKWLAVSQILSDARNDFDHHESLEGYGVAACFNRRGRRDVTNGYGEKLLFIAHRVAGRLLLKGTHWEGQSIDQVLRRVSGAKLSRRRVAGALQYGVAIPWEKIESFLGLAEEIQTVEHKEQAQRSKEQSF